MSAFCIDISTFLLRARAMFADKNVVFKDLYFRALFELAPPQFEMVIKQFQGVCGVINIDMTRRYEMQSKESIPESTFSTNDRAETLNATASTTRGGRPTYPRLPRRASPSTM